MRSHLQVAWIKSDSKAILAIHTLMVALNPRLSVTHNGHNTWKLHISHVQLNDSGSYMVCTLCRKCIAPLQIHVLNTKSCPLFYPKNVSHKVSRYVYKIYDANIKYTRKILNLVFFDFYTVNTDPMRSQVSIRLQLPDLIISPNSKFHFKDLNPKNE